MASTDGDLAPAGLPPLPALPDEVRRDLAFSVDAVADLLVVEGVHSIVGGDHARAQATLTGLAWGEAPPSELRSLVEMRDRLSIPVLLASIVTDRRRRAGWATDRPRARVAPAAEAFAQRMLPPPASCVVTVEREGAAPVDVSLATLGVCALDVVNDGPGIDESGSLMEARLLAAAGPGASRLASAPADGRIGWPQLRAIARRVRTVLSAARPLSAGDLVIEEDVPVPPSAAAAESVAACRAALDAELGALQPLVDALGVLLDTVDAAEHDADLTAGQVADLRAATLALEPFGIGRSVPLPDDDVLTCARIARSGARGGAGAAGELGCGRATRHRGGPDPQWSGRRLGLPSGPAGPRWPSATRP